MDVASVPINSSAEALRHHLKTAKDLRLRANGEANTARDRLTPDLRAISDAVDARRGL